MYVSNLHEYGRLIKPDNFETHHLHNDIFNIFENRLVSECYNVLMYALFVQDWEQKYLHVNYSLYLNDVKDVPQVFYDNSTSLENISIIFGEM